MIRYLLDTNSFSYAVRQRSQAFNQRFQSIHASSIAVSVVTEAELLFGLARRPEAHALSRSVHALLGNIAILPWAPSAARHYAGIRAELERRGLPMDDMDMMIAAHAMAENATLVTSDAAFRRIERLSLEDWTL